MYLVRVRVTVTVRARVQVRIRARARVRVRVRVGVRVRVRVKGGGVLEGELQREAAAQRHPDVSELAVARVDPGPPGVARRPVRDVEGRLVAQHQVNARAVDVAHAAVPPLVRLVEVGPEAAQVVHDHVALIRPA